MDATHAILATVAVMILASLIGRRVQKITYFGLPHDYYTAEFAILMFASSIIAAIFLDGVYWMFLLVAVFAYFYGYVLSASKSWVNFARAQLDKPMPGLPVKWQIIGKTDDGHYFLADQTWADLRRRRKYGVYHILHTNAPLVPNLWMPIETYFLPKTNAPTITVSKWQKMPSEMVKVGRVRYKKRIVYDNGNKYKEKVAWQKEVEQKNTLVRLPHPLNANHIERMVDEEAHHIADEALEDMSYELTIMGRQAESGFMNAARKFNNRTVIQSTPVHKFINGIRSKKKSSQDIEEIADENKEGEKDVK